MPNKYTDEQIKKMLDTIIKQTKHRVLKGITDNVCCLDIELVEAMRDLINRQEAEKAELQREIASYKTKIEALKDRNTTLEKLYVSFLPAPQTATAQREKEQAERAKDAYIRELYTELEKQKEKATHFEDMAWDLMEKRNGMECMTFTKVGKEEFLIFSSNFGGYSMLQKHLKSEAIKEFAERLCEGRVSNDPVVIAVKVELEMVGESE